MASTVHSFYQNVYLPDAELDVDQLKNTVREQRTKATDLAAENARLRGANDKLVGLLQKYRSIVRELQGKITLLEKGPEPRKRNKPPLLSISTDYVGSIDTSEIALENTHRSEPPHSVTATPGRLSVAESNATTKTVSPAPHDINAGTTIAEADMEEDGEEDEGLELLTGVCKSMRRIVHAASAKQLVEGLYLELAALFRPKRLGIFVIDKQLRRLFQKEKGVVTPISINRESIDLAVNEQTQANCSMCPAFSSLSVLKSSFKKGSTLVIPAQGQHGTPYLALQIDLASHKGIHKRSRLLDDSVFPLTFH